MSGIHNVTMELHRHSVHDTFPNMFVDLRRVLALVWGPGFQNVSFQFEVYIRKTTPSPAVPVIKADGLIKLSGVCCGRVLP